MLETRLIDVSDMGFPCRIAATLCMPVGTPHGIVLAVHGLTRQKRDFDDMALALADAGYEVWSVDVPGRGGSSWLPSAQHYALDTYARVMAALIDQQGWGAVHWVGSSMGGLIAMELAAQGRAALLHSLTLVDVTHKPNAAACARIAGYLPDVLPLITDRAAYLAFVKQNLPLGNVSDEVWARFADHQLVAVPGGHMAHFDPALIKPAKEALAAGIDMTAGLQSVTCPVALVAGGVSDLCTSREIEDLRVLRPDVRVHICADAGHIPALADAPTNNFIRAFIDAAGVS